jgi:hypothetical protein
MVSLPFVAYQRKLAETARETHQIKGKRVFNSSRKLSKFVEMWDIGLR